MQPKAPGPSKGAHYKHTTQRDDTLLLTIAGKKPMQSVRSAAASIGVGVRTSLGGCASVIMHAGTHTPTGVCLHILYRWALQLNLTCGNYEVLHVIAHHAYEPLAWRTYMC
jgi:hypothetical protein